MKLYMKIRIEGSIVGYARKGREHIINSEHNVKNLEEAQAIVDEADFQEYDVQNTVISALVYPGKIKLLPTIVEGHVNPLNFDR